MNEHANDKIISQFISSAGKDVAVVIDLPAKIIQFENCHVRRGWHFCAEPKFGCRLGELVAVMFFKGPRNGSELVIVTPVAEAVNSENTATNFQKSGRKPERSPDVPDGP